jgi:hypothetical protein
MRRLGLVSALGLLVLGVASHTLAEPPPDDAERARRLERRTEQARERLRRLGVPVPSGSTPPAASGAPPASVPAPSGSVLPASEHLAELARRWKALGENRLERRDRNRAALVRQLGQRLSDPRVKDELRLHATRVAELARLQFLAENARTGAAREKLLARIGKLSAREAERHQKQLAKLTAAAGAPSSSAAAPSAAPAPSEGAKP